MAEDTPTIPLPVKAQPAVREMGFASSASAAGSGAWWSSLSDDLEQIPELRWPKSNAIYDRMRRSDPQVSSVLRAVTHPVRRTPWRIDPNGARDEVVQHVAEDLGLPIIGSQTPPGRRTRDRFSWAQHLQMALLMLPFGHMVFEQVYRVDEATGKLRLRKLGPRLPHTISGWNVARDGGLISVEQSQFLTGVVGDVKPTTLPVSRLVVYVHEREGGQWWGTSLLRSAYGPWMLKDHLLRIQAQAVERNGMGVPVFTAPQGAGQDVLDKGTALAQQFRAGDMSGVGIPGGATMQLLAPNGQLIDPLQTIRYLDDSIAKAVLAHVLSLTGKTGSYALGATYADIFAQSLQAIAENIADTASDHIVGDLVDLNWGPEEPAPRIVFDEIGGKAEAVAQAVQTLVSAGAITPDDALEAFMRSSLGLPAEDGTATTDPTAPEEVP